MEKDNLFYYIFALLLDAVCAQLTLKQAQLTKLAEYWNKKVCVRCVLYTSWDWFGENKRWMGHTFKQQ